MGIEYPAKESLAASDSGKEALGGSEMPKEEPLGFLYLPSFWVKNQCLHQQICGCPF